jgi:hypothetical protein
VKKVNAEVPEDSSGYPCKEHISMNNKLMFYQTHGETVWTGDIYKTTGLPKYDDYAIVLTPVCDLVQNKTAKVLTCIGFPVVETYFKDKKYPPYIIDNAVKDVALKGQEEKTAEYIKNRYMLGKPKLSDSLFFLWNFEDEEKNFGLCFNFNNVQTIDGLEIDSKWRKVCRLDSPFIQEMLEKYGRFASRVGTPEINFSPLKLNEKINGAKQAVAIMAVKPSVIKPTASAK